MSNYVPPTAPMGQPPQYPGGPQQQGYYQAPPPPQQKSKTWLWVLGGCGTVILLGAIAASVLGYFAYKKTTEFVEEAEKNPASLVAKMISVANPEVEVVSVDEGKGVIVVKDRKTGKQVTVNLEDAKNGKFVFQEDGKDAVTIEAKGEGESGSVVLKSEQGSMKMGAGSDAEMPGWMPSYPGASAQGNYSMKTKDGDSGSFHFTTNDSIERVIAFYEAELKAIGLTVNTTSWKANGAVVGGNVTGDERSNNRSVNVTLASDKGATQVTVVFAVKQ
jgi:hypothetical protein